MSANMECHFSFTVLAPEGLNNLENLIKESNLGLYIYHSHFNNKNILKSNTNNLIELEMDTSTTDIMFGSGSIFASFEKAQKTIKLISNIFSQAGYPHKIGVDNETGEKTVRLEYGYS